MFKKIFPPIENESNQSPQDPGYINIQRAFWVAIIFTSIAVSSFGAGIFLTVTQPYWQIYVMLVIAAFSVLFDVLAVVLIKRGRAGTGIKILYWSGLITLPLNNLLFPGVMPILVVIVLVMGFVNIYLLFPKAWRKYAPYGSIAAALFMWLVDYLNPPFRFSVSVLPTASFFGPLMLAILVIGVLFLIIRQAWNSNIRVKLSTSFMVIAMVSVLIVAFPAQRSLSASLTTVIDNNLSELSNRQAIEIAVSIDREKDILKVLSLSQAIRDAALEAASAAPLSQADITRLDEQWRAADAADNNADPLVAGVINNAIASELRSFRGQFPQHVEVFLTNTQGLSIASTNRTSDYLQADEEWWQTAYQNGVFIGQPEYDDSSKTIAMIMAVSVRENGDGRVLGVLRTTVNFTTLTDTLALGLFGQTGRTNIYLPDGRELKLNVKADNTVELVEAAAPSEITAMTQSASKYQTISLNGIPVLASMAVVRTIGNTTEDTALISGLDWRVVTLQDQAEAQQPVNDQTRNTTILVFAIITVVAFAGRGLANVISGPIIRLNTIAEKVATGDLTVEAKVETRDEVGALTTTFNSMTTRLRDMIGSLEQRVADRTRNLELAAEVGRAVSQVRKLDVMLKDACELILKEFNLYYVQVYLADPGGLKLKLEAGTGSVGAQLLERGHSLPLNTGSINGRAAVEKRPVVISNTAQSATFRQNPLLPDTQGEMAVPLIVADKVVGVLDMQSNAPGTLTEEILPAFEALAGQLAVAIQNANLLAETEQARAQVEAQARRLVRSGWSEHLDAIHKPEQLGYVYDRNNVTPLANMDASQLPENGHSVSAPISVTGESLGSLVVELDDETRAEQTSELVNIVARQVAQQIENLRLLESAERYRSEAEKAARLQTVEGWQEYIASRETERLGYMYDTKEVRPQGHRQGDGGSMFATPLKARDETIGKLSVQGLTHDDQESVDLVNAVAERLGTHIESLRLFEETKRGQVELDKRARHLAAVAEISTASSQELEVDKLLSTVVHLTQREFDLYHAHVFIFNETAQELQIAACGWKEGDEHEGTHETNSIPLNREQSLVARAARTGRAVIVNNVFTEPGWLPNSMLPDTASEMAVPLVVGDRVLGVLDVQSDHINAFTEEDANIQTTLASQVATALQNARSFSQAQKQAEREAMLNVINQKIQSATSVEAVLQIAARELGTALGAPMTVAQLSLKDKSS